MIRTVTIKAEWFKIALENLVGLIYKPNKKEE